MACSPNCFLHVRWSPRLKMQCCAWSSQNWTLWEWRGDSHGKCPSSWTTAHSPRLYRYCETLDTVHMVRGRMLFRIGMRRSWRPSFPKMPPKFTQDSVPLCWGPNRRARTLIRALLRCGSYLGWLCQWKLPLSLWGITWLESRCPMHYARLTSSTQLLLPGSIRKVHWFSSWMLLNLIPSPFWWGEIPFENR